LSFYVWQHYFYFFPAQNIYDIVLYIISLNERNTT
jgi:hypothetical protein